MADPVSLVASIIAIIGAASTVSKTLSKVKLLRNAPAGLLELNNEITELTIVLRTIEGHLSSTELEGSAPPQDILQQISNLIDRAKDRLLQLDQLIHYQFLQSGTLDGDYKVFRVRWIRAKETIESHRRALQEIRQGILLQAACLELNFLTVSSVQQSRIRLMVNEVFLITTQIRTTQHSDFDQAVRQLNRHSDLLTDILARHGQLHNRLQSTQRLIIQQDEQLQLVSRERVMTNRIPSVVGIRAHLSPYQRAPCPSACRYDCHTVRSFGSPSLLKDILGFMFVRYSGHPIGLARQCSEVICQSQTQFKARAVYYFSFWLFSKMIDMSLMLSCLSEPSASLAMRGVFSSDTAMFQAILLDDDQGLQDLFGRRSGRPSDVMVLGGDSALSIALQHSSYKVGKMLCETGADPYLEDNNGLSAFMYTWDIVHTKSHDQASLKFLRELLPDNDNVYFQERSFSRLHKAVLGIDPLDLEQVLNSDGHDVNKLDSNGSSPLIWAVRRKDNISVELLLKAGADPNIRTRSMSTALHFAATLSNLHSVKLLLQHGAIATHKDIRLRNALHYAAKWTRGSYQMFNILLAAGIDIETQDMWGTTALGFSAIFDNKFGLTALLDLGAQIDSVDSEGDSPLLDATFGAQAGSVQVLLERGANCILANSRGNTILHVAAQSGDLRILHILGNANLKVIDPYARNAKGKTAFELAQARVSKPDGFIDLFLVLIFEIRNRNDHLAGCSRPIGDASTGVNVAREINEDNISGCDSDAEEFFDAEEQ